MGKDQYDKGVRFWLPGVRHAGPPDKDYKYFDHPFPNPKLGKPADYKSGVIHYNGKPLEFTGEIYIDDPELVLYFFKKPGRMRFDPQQGVDLGYVTAAHCRELGYEVEDRDVKPVDPAPEKERPKLTPDVAVMSKPDLEEFARVDLKVKMDPNLSKKKMEDFIKAECKKQGYLPRKK